MAPARDRDPKMFENASSKKTAKLPVAEPTSFSQVFVALVMYGCKRYLMVDTNWKVGLYLCGVTVVSLFTDLFPFPATYFSSSKNPLNVYLVKWGLAWTLVLIGPFIYLTSTTYCIDDKKIVFRRHLSRILVIVFWWFLCVSLMNYVEHITGICTSGSAEHFNKYVCKMAGYSWKSWDPSGHAFLLCYSLLVISEEVKCFSTWSTISEVIENKDGKPSWNLSPDDAETLRYLYKQNTPFVQCLIVLLTFLQFTWEVMLLATSVYFHTMPSKLVGLSLAILGWFLTYQWWYKQIDAVPSRPGMGKFRYMKEL